VYIFCFLLCLTTKLEFFNFFIVATYFRFETHSLVFHHFLLLFIQILSPLFSSLKERQRLCVIVFVCIRVGYVWMCVCVCVLCVCGYMYVWMCPCGVSVYVYVWIRVCVWVCVIPVCISTNTKQSSLFNFSALESSKIGLFTFTFSREL